MKWLQWMLDNAFAVVIVGGVLLQLLQAITKKKGGVEDPPAEQPKEYEFEDPELAERTRKIREEIQRKIDQRTRGYTETPATETAIEPAAPPPVIREATVTQTPVQSTSVRWDTQRQAEILEEQAAWADRLAEAKSRSVSVQKRMHFENATADHSATERVASRTGVLGDLRNPEALRRAFILREVLGPPVALRK
jgi:hypothetical protein